MSTSDKNTVVSESPSESTPSDSAQKGDSANGLSILNGIEDRVKDLSKLLSTDTDGPEGEVNVAELIQQLETSDAIADDLEERLDSILSKLDALMGSLDEPSLGDDAKSLDPTNSNRLDEDDVRP